MKTHCSHGHEFTPENIYVLKRGGRRCRACRLAYASRHYLANLKASSSRTGSKGSWKDFPTTSFRPYLGAHPNLVALCRETGLAYRTLIRIKNGESKWVSLGVADRLCIAFDLDLDNMAVAS